MTAPLFQISTYCHQGGCVAVAALDNGSIAVRHAVASDSLVLSFTPAEWDAFVAGVKDGEFDRETLESARAVCP